MPLDWHLISVETLTALDFDRLVEGVEQRECMAYGDALLRLDRDDSRWSPEQREGLPPDSYWPKYVERFSRDELALTCKWHALPDKWWSMDYDEFLTARRPLIAHMIRAGYEKLSGSVA